MDEELKQKLIDKIENDDFGEEDLADFLNLFCQMANEVDDIQDEISGDFENKTLQFYIPGFKDFILRIVDKKFTIEDGVTDQWDSSIKTNSDNFAKLMTGKKDGNSLYMAGELEGHGGLPNIIRFQKVLQIILEELDV